MDVQPATKSGYKPGQRSNPSKKQKNQPLDFSLPEKLFMLTIDDDKGDVSSTVKHSLRYCLAGASLADLAIRGKITLDKKKLQLKDSVSTGEALFDDVLTSIASEKKPHKLTYWIDNIGTKALEKHVAARLVDIFNTAGLSAGVSTEITDYLARHAAFVAPLAHMLILHHCDNHAIARATADLALLVDVLRETQDVLDAVGVKTAHDRMTSIIRRTPKFILVLAMRILLPTRYMEVGGAWHCMQAPDEMHQLGVELMALVDQSGLPTPALHKLFAMSP